MFTSRNVLIYLAHFDWVKRLNRSELQAERKTPNDERKTASRRFTFGKKDVRGLVLRNQRVGFVEITDQLVDRLDERRLSVVQIPNDDEFLTCSFG